MVTTIYPDAGEATMCVFTPRGELVEVEGQGDVEPADPAVAWERANRRARSRSRRYIVANRLRFMWVLTWPGEGLHGTEGRAEAMRATGALVRKLRSHLDVDAYWFSPELHPGGHGWHVNLFVARRLPHAQVERLWDHGYVWAKDWTKDTRVRGGTFLERLRAGASYGAKYAAKDWSTEVLDRSAHRYELAQGHEPAQLVAWCWSLEEGLDVVRQRLGHLAHVWRSSEVDGWDGPPCWVAFAGGPSG